MLVVGSRSVDVVVVGMEHSVAFCLYCVDAYFAMEDLCYCLVALREYLEFQSLFANIFVI